MVEFLFNSSKHLLLFHFLWEFLWPYPHKDQDIGSNFILFYSDFVLHDCRLWSIFMVLYPARRNVAHLYPLLWWDRLINTMKRERQLAWPPRVVNFCFQMLFLENTALRLAFFCIPFFCGFLSRIPLVLSFIAWKFL